MANDVKLQKLNLGPDWIDLSFGEPKVVMDCLFRQLNRVGDPFKMPTLYDLPKWSYQPAAGKPDLVSLLEKKYGCKVVICNGAKQALSGSLYAFKKSGATSVWFEQPFYPANPSLVESSGLIRSLDYETAESLIITSPNNPDGAISEVPTGRPVIHDAAYHTEIYLPDGDEPIKAGDIQVFSISKMYGASGLRIGYAVCHNEKYYKDVCSYVEMSTAGVSAPSQDIARNIELFFRDYPEYYKEFVKEARSQIALSRKELQRIDPDVLRLVPTTTNSMFGWFEAGPALNNKEAKVHILPGELFGQPGMMRMNIAHPPELIKQAVDRLNKFKI